MPEPGRWYWCWPDAGSNPEVVLVEQVVSSVGVVSIVRLRDGRVVPACDVAHWGLHVPEPDTLHDAVVTLIDRVKAAGRVIRSAAEATTIASLSVVTACVMSATRPRDRL